MCVYVPLHTFVQVYHTHFFMNFLPYVNFSLTSLKGSQRFYGAKKEKWKKSGSKELKERKVFKKISSFIIIRIKADESEKIREVRSLKRRRTEIRKYNTRMYSNSCGQSNEYYFSMLKTWIPRLKNSIGWVQSQTTMN